MDIQKIASEFKELALRRDSTSKCYYSICTLGATIKFRAFDCNNSISIYMDYLTYNIHVRLHAYSPECLYDHDGIAWNNNSEEIFNRFMDELRSA